MDETERLESTLYSIKNWAEQILGIAQRIRDDNDIEQINKVVAQSRQIILEANQAIAEAHPEPAAPPPAAASDDATTRERLAEYAADVAEARSLEAEYQSMHNGKMREEHSEDWYGSPAFNQYELATIADMGGTMPRVLAYIAALESALADAESDRARLAAALEPFAEVWETWGYREEDTTNFVAWMHLSSQLGNVALRAAFEAAANALADGGE